MYINHYTMLPLSLPLERGFFFFLTVWYITEVVRTTLLISIQRCIGIAILRQQSVSTGLILRNLGGGGLLVGKIEFGRILQQ